MGIEQKYYQPDSVRTRHLAIMDLMLARPDLTQNQIAEALNYTPSRLSIIVNSPLFQLAFKEYRRKMEDDLVGLITEATASAIRFSKAVVEDKDMPPSLRQVSAKDILSQGHARAPENMRVERRNLNANIEVPLEALGALTDVIREAKTPTALPKRVYRPAVNPQELPASVVMSEGRE